MLLPLFSSWFISFFVMGTSLGWAVTKLFLDQLTLWMIFLLPEKYKAMNTIFTYASTHLLCSFLLYLYQVTNIYQYHRADTIVYCALLPECC